MILATTVLLLTAQAAEAFAPSHHMRAFVSARGGTRPLHGVIYNPDGSIEDDSSSGNALYQNEPVTKRPAGVQGPQWTGPLARLAAHHQPGLEVTNIDSVDIIGCSDRHCDIAVAVCEDEGCVSLSVPVSLLNTCTDDLVFDDCVMEK